MDLTGYKPEAPETNSGFEPFKYEGPVRVNKAVISVNDKIDSEYYAIGCNQIDIEVEVLQGEFTGRRLWKRFNLDSEKADGKGKTPAMKLADQLFTVGLAFTNMDSLTVACNTLVDQTILIKAWVAKFNDKTMQAWNIKGVFTGEIESTVSSVDF